MLQRKEKATGSSRAVELHLVPSAKDAWSEIILPWFKKVLPNSWKRETPSLILVPTRGQANDLKARLIAEGLSHLGLQFLTPASLDALLARSNPARSPAPEHLRLLLAIAASEMESRPDESEALAAKAVARAPASLLRALRSQEAAGWKFEDLEIPAFTPIVRRFNQLLERCNFVLPGEADRQWLREAEQGSDRKFDHLLITCFNGAHWAHWFFLRAAVEQSEQATIIIEEPEQSLSDADVCWIGSWEEAYGEARRATKSLPETTDSLFSEAEMRGETALPKRVDFLIGTNISEQAQAVSRQCVDYMAEEKCSRLAVVFPAAGALSRLVSNALAEFDIPHNDGLAHFVPGIFESPEWLAWIALQRAPRLNSFLHFLNVLPDARVLSSEISREKFERILRRSYDEILLDDLDILREFCARGDDQYQAVASALKNLPLLPSRASFTGFLEITAAAFQHLGWKQHALEIDRGSYDWAKTIDVEFPRSIFLRWLEETAVSFRPARATEGDHPYARVQLLSVAQALNQEWSHLILAGWNESAWPPPPGPEFADTEQIRLFNQKVRELNRRASRQGSQGEGHVSVREDRAFYPGPLEQRAIALRQFDALLESTTEAVTLTASLVQEDAPERLWNPSECLTRLYLNVRRKPLTQSTLKDLCRETKLLSGQAASTADVQQTVVAFTARRDSATRIGEYDFALLPNGSYRPEPTLSVSDLEQMVSSPGIIWIKRYLGAEAPDDTTNPWAAASGKWVHRWLAGMGDAKNGGLFGKFPAAATIDGRVRGLAEQRRCDLEKLCHTLGKSVPDWWTSGWLNAVYLARYLGAKIGTATDWGWMVAEMPIGREGKVKIDEGIELQLRGQIDLILGKKDAPNFGGQNVWIIDYKTNSSKELKRHDLHDNLVKGNTLQLGLYSLAVRALGAAEVNASIISLAVKAVAPQLSVTELLPHTNVFADLAEMQRTGIFGMKGEIRPGYGYSTPYPLATLAIDPDILEDKWALTHPALVLEKEEWEIW